MKNEKTNEEMMNEKAEPIIQYHMATNCIRYLSKNIIVQIRQLNISISGLNKSLISTAGGNILIRERVMII